jgi:hypothetical protein
MDELVLPVVLAMAVAYLVLMKFFEHGLGKVYRDCDKKSAARLFSCQ